ncbi:MAG: AAA family ATPase [Lachnospiraceae bacterium]|nr:AAA family ATPase [Lachnospiraceae bacterium]
MGIYLNPGFENFRRTLSADIYVDKTMMIAATNRFIDKGNNYVCMSRPRRFGKTVTSEMLCSYYSKGCDARELFAPYKIAKDPSFENKLNRYNVIKIDWNSEYQNVEDTDNLIKIVTEKVKTEMRKEFPGISLEPFDSLGESILKIYGETGETFVILMDEYDVFIREHVTRELFEKYLRLLNALFKSSTLRPAISLAYLTGILPVARDKVQSKLNNFREYTILDAMELAEYVGFTADEVKELCRRYDMDYEECRNWYDGYAQHGYEIYNPESVVNAMLQREYDGYWNRTSTYMAIAERIRCDLRGTKEDVLRMLSGESADVNVTRFMNTMDSFHTKSDVFTYLIHLGYLAYNKKEKTCRIPNKEVRQEWFNAIEDDPNYDQTNKIIFASKQLLMDTIEGNNEAIARALSESHIHVTSNRSYNNEDALGSAIYLAYIYALNDYLCFRELPAGKGFADVVYIPLHPGCGSRPAIIVELKRGGSAGSALKQIADRQYFKPLEGYYGKILLVGINYDEKTKTHSAQTRWYVKE